MKDKELFQLALGLGPWIVVAYEFSPDKGRLDIELDFPPGRTLPCPECEAEGCKVHDSERKTWRHLNFFQYEAYLNATYTPCPVFGVQFIFASLSLFINFGTRDILDEERCLFPFM